MHQCMRVFGYDNMDCKKAVLDGYCEIIEMYDTGVLDLDHENDFEIMEVIAEYLFKKDMEFKEITDNINEKEYGR